MSKNHFYLFWDGLIILIIWILIMISSILIFRGNYLLLALGIVASFYFVPKALKCILFLVDKKKGLNHQEAVFQGILNEEKLDVFYRITYANIYFDDEILKKNYMVFLDVQHEDIKRGDVLRISYYPLTRVILKIEKVPACELKQARKQI